MQLRVLTHDISIHSPHARGDFRSLSKARTAKISIHSPHARGDPRGISPPSRETLFQSTPLMRGETWIYIRANRQYPISIHSPHARGDSINLQKSFWIQGSLYNKNITAHFSKTLKPFLWPKIKLLWVRSLPKSHDSFTFARLFRECISSLHDLTSHALRQMICINVKLIILKTTRSGNLRFTLNIHEFEQLPRGGFA